MITTEQRERVVLAARALVGLPYVWGGNTPKDGGLDCSGFVQWCAAVAGVEPWASRFPNGLDMTAHGLFTGCRPFGGDEHALPGSLAFYGASAAFAAEPRATHVVLVAAVGPTGTVREVIGASRGDRACTSPAVAIAKGARIRTFPTHLYRQGFIGFRDIEVVS